jgi:SAM-dependent methyltransferase
MPSDITSDEILDVGCGPSSFLESDGGHPVGLDFSSSYVRAYTRSGGLAVVGNADQIPYAPGAFRMVCSVGLFHHLTDNEVRDCLQELVNCCCSGGRIVILDGVLPTSVWRRPLAYLIRRGDRGRYMRSQQSLLALMPSVVSWRVERFDTAKTGLEAILCVATPD